MEQQKLHEIGMVDLGVMGRNLSLNMVDHGFAAAGNDKDRTKVEAMNGIEYGVMQLIAETYDLMKRGLGLNDDELHEEFSAWNDGELNGYPMEITGRIFSKVDEKTGRRLIDEISTWPSMSCPLTFMFVKAPRPVRTTVFLAD